MKFLTIIKNLFIPDSRPIVNLWWSKTPKPGNLGDILSPLILRHLGFNVKRVSRDSINKFLAIGSITKFIKSNDTVWGSGIMHDDDPISENAHYLAVRGPLTGKKVNCDVFGDPALLCPVLFPFENTKEKKLGIIPHYIDYQKEMLGNDIKSEINILNSNPLKVIRLINDHSEVISSSLHGIILAHAYGVPAGWWRPSSRLDGDDSKFRDYAESVGINLKPSRDYEKTNTVLPSIKRVKEIQANLLSALENFKNA